MQSFASRVIDWQKEHGRHDLPWQQTRDPYRVWLSEIMLQQTQVSTVIPYYLRFLERFPTLASLAGASIDEVMPYWAGLGYYSRARNLHRAAQAIAAHYGGVFPQCASHIAELPGIGRSTAAAIASFCFGERAAILDGNVKRVLCRVFAVEGVPTGAVERGLWELAERELPQHGIDAYTQGLMDLGATLCTRSKPRCSDCPLHAMCKAFAQGRTAELPTTKAAKTIPVRSTAALLLVADGRVLLERRPPHGIWSGLLSLPEIPEESGALAFAQTRFGMAAGNAHALPVVRHTFSHFRLLLTPWRIELPRIPASVQEAGHKWLPISEAQEAALPTPIRKLLLSLET